MKCPECGEYNLKVVNSRSNDIITCRQRKCQSCGYTFYTKEEIDNSAKILLSRIHNETYHNK